MNKHIYLIGIGGVGMLWIADYCLQQGWQVSGSDLTETPALKRLREKGVNIHIGSDGTIPDDVTEAVISAAITPKAPMYGQLQELERRQIPYQKRAAWTGALTRQYYTICIAGTHGKTTTTAMVGWILDQAGLDPTVFMGGSFSAWDGTRIGKSKYLVIEADEYDRSFHNFSARIAVILNIDLDHTDYYTGGMDEIEQSFKKFLRNLPSSVHVPVAESGIVIGYGRDKHIRKVARGFKYRFRWYDEKNLFVGARVPQPGNQYLLNATAAAKVAHELGVDAKTIQKALQSFPGVMRRFERLGEFGQAELYDDYGHHPTEIAATLKGARDRWKRGETKLTLVFQPHQKARTKSLLAEFGRCFDADAPDKLILAPIYFVAGREDDIEISSADIATEIAKKAPKNMEVIIASDQNLEQLVREAAGEPGVVLVMGAGDIRQKTDGWRGAA